MLQILSRLSLVSTWRAGEVNCRAWIGQSGEVGWWAWAVQDVLLSPWLVVIRYNHNAVPTSVKKRRVPEHWGEGREAVGAESIGGGAGVTRPELQESIRQKTEASRSVKSELQKYCASPSLPFMNILWVTIQIWSICFSVSSSIFCRFSEKPSLWLWDASIKNYDCCRTFLKQKNFTNSQVCSS